MSTTLPEATIQAMIESRRVARDNKMLSLAGESVMGLQNRARDVGLNAADFDNTIELIAAITDKSYPPLDFQIGSKAGPSRRVPHGGTVDLTVPITEDVDHEFSYLDQRPDAARLAAMGEDTKRAFEWPGDSPNQWGGVDLLDVISNSEPSWWNDRFFVGFRDHGRVVKLDVQAIETMEGHDFGVEFGGAFDRPHRVVIVHIPSWWLDADYVARSVKTAFHALQHGAPDQAYRALRTLCIEQNWIDEGLAPDVSQPLIENLARSLVADIEAAALTGDIENVRHAIQTVQRQRGWIEGEADQERGDSPLDGTADTAVIPVFEGIDKPDFEAQVQAKQDERSGQWGPWGKDGRQGV